MESNSDWIPAVVDAVLKELGLEVEETKLAVDSDDKTG